MTTPEETAEEMIAEFRSAHGEAEEVCEIVCAIVSCDSILNILSELVSKIDGSVYSNDFIVINDKAKYYTQVKEILQSKI